MANPNSNPRKFSFFFIGIYLLGIGYFVAQFLSLDHPIVGFAWLPQYGSHFHERKTDEFKDTKHLVTSEYGYDGQFYSQLALSPTLRQDGLEDALDSFNYRARRIFFSWTAYALGLGQPDWILQVYSVQNAIFWLLLAILLLHWFPPNSWQNAIRYIGTLYAPGLIMSATHALLDGPSLFLIALGAVLIEKNKQTSGCIALALSVLGKETSIISAALIPLPKGNSPRGFLNYLRLGAIISLPIGLWVLYVSRVAGNSQGNSGSNNFNYPFASWFSSLTNNLESLFIQGMEAWNGTYLLMLVSLMGQAAYFLLKPHPKSKWWRLGVTYAVLMLVLGDAVWEGYMGGAVRAVLPLTLAFNVLLPKTKQNLSLLILANSLSFVGFTHLASIAPPPQHLYIQSQNPNINIAPGFDRTGLQFQDGWYDHESLENEYWIWSKDNSALLYTVHRAQPIPALLQFQTRSISSRRISISLNHEPIESLDYEQPNMTEMVEISLLLQPGENLIEFSTDTPADSFPGDPRELAFALYNFILRLGATSNEP